MPINRYEARLWATLLLAAYPAAVPPARAEIVTTGYRESAESFTWELEWDGNATAERENLVPSRSESPDARSWSGALSVAPNPKSARTIRFAFEARHASRLHEMDAPQGGAYRVVLYLDRPLRGPRDWIRLDAKQLPHLATPKDHTDSFDVLFRVEEDAAGKKTGRLVFQAAHGPAARAKKVGKPNEKSSKARTAPKP